MFIQKYLSLIMVFVRTSMIRSQQKETMKKVTIKLNEPKRMHNYYDVEESLLYDFKALLKFKEQISNQAFT